MLLAAPIVTQAEGLDDGAAALGVERINSGFDAGTLTRGESSPPRPPVGREQARGPAPCYGRR